MKFYFWYILTTVTGIIAIAAMCAGLSVLGNLLMATMIPLVGRIAMELIQYIRYLDET